MKLFIFSVLLLAGCSDSTVYINQDVLIRDRIMKMHACRDMCDAGVKEFIPSSGICSCFEPKLAIAKKRNYLEKSLTE